MLKLQYSFFSITIKSKTFLINSYIIAIEQYPSSDYNNLIDIDLVLTVGN